MAYMLFNSSHDRDNLKYTLEGGDPGNPVIDIQLDNGTILKGMGLAGCFITSIPVPEPLFVSVPKKIIVRPWRGGFIADFGKAADYMTYIVSDRFVDIVERLEPGVHQFLPIAESLDNKGQPLARRFYLLNVLTRLAAIDVERSTVIWQDSSFEHNGKRIESTTLNFRPGAINSDKFVGRREIIDGHHLWQGNREGLMGQYFCSNQLHDAMREEDLSSFWFIPMDEV